MLRITAAEIMQSPVETVSPDTTATAAAAKLDDHDIGSLVVVTNGEPSGIVTEGDLTGLLAAGGDPAAVSVEDVMRGPVITVDATATLTDAATLLRDHGIKRLPVVDDDGGLVGIVTTTDLATFLPHLSGGPGRRRPDQTPDESRSDTAYEDTRWEYEYVGDDAQIDVGDVITFSKQLSADDVAAFADASGDTNRLHMEAAYAAQTRFGGRIAHGTLVAGVISAALARLPGLIIYLSQDVSYLGPVPVGDTVTATCRVVERLGDDKFRLTTTVSRSDDETVIDGEAVVLSDPIPDV